MMAEILAPAGSFEALKAAVINGADAVYIGLSKFSARAKAENFNNDVLLQALNYAHLYGVKVYIAINTLVKNEEMSDALSDALFAIDSGADAIILQDLGLSELIRKARPSAILHASTQMGIHNLEGAIIAKQLGFTRVILSRECTLSEIKRIKNGVDIEVECFVQGALCIAFSGNCYFSSLASGFSGNRGKCMQLCRKKYSLMLNGKTRTGYLLSAKDLMLATKLKDLVDAGVDSFKIEGRLRRNEYVAESIRIYKKACNENITDNEINCLKRVFNRGDFTQGHLYDPTNRVIDYKINSHKGLFYCKVKEVRNRIAILEKSLCKGDGIKFLRNGFEVGGALLQSNGDKTGFDGSVYKGDDVFITTDAEFNKKVCSRTRKLPVSVKLDFENNTLTLTCDNNIATMELSGYETILAENRPITISDVVENFNKNEYFFTENAEVIGERFVRRSTFNEIRRVGYDILQNIILKNYACKMQKYNEKPLIMSDIIRGSAVNIPNDATIYTVSEPSQVVDEMEYIIVNPIEYSPTSIENFYRFTDKKLLLSLPPIARDNDVFILKSLTKAALDNGFYGIVANNLYSFAICDGPFLLGPMMNCLNDVIDLPKIYSFESDFLGKKGFVYAQGNVPLMTFCNCPKKEFFDGCGSCDGYEGHLSDGVRNFELRRYKVGYCYCQMLNSAYIDVTDKVKQGKVIDFSYNRPNQKTLGNHNRELK